MLLNLIFFTWKKGCWTSPFFMGKGIKLLSFFHSNGNSIYTESRSTNSNQVRRKKERLLNGNVVFLKSNLIPLFLNPLLRISDSFINTGKFSQDLSGSSVVVVSQNLTNSFFVFLIFWTKKIYSQREKRIKTTLGETAINPLLQNERNPTFLYVVVVVASTSTTIHSSP